MSDKLQQLTDRLYDEGLSKGRVEGEKILEKAKSEAESILSDARSQASAIIDKARSDAAELRFKTESDVRMASRLALQSVKGEIENICLEGICKESVTESLKDPEYLKKIILEVCRNFSATQGTDISLSLPERLKDELDPWLNGELKDLIGKGVRVSFSGNLQGGFSIAPAEGGWFISLSDDTFNELVSSYLRPFTRKLLFGH